MHDTEAPATNSLAELHVLLAHRPLPFEPPLGASRAPLRLSQAALEGIRVRCGVRKAALENFSQWCCSICKHFEVRTKTLQHRK